MWSGALRRGILICFPFSWFFFRLLYITWECHCMAETKEKREAIRKESKKRRTKVNRNSIIEVYGWLTLEAFRHFIKYVVPDPTRSKTVCEPNRRNNLWTWDGWLFSRWLHSIAGVECFWQMEWCECVAVCDVHVNWNQIQRAAHTRHFISLFLCFHFQSSTIRFHSQTSSLHMPHIHIVRRFANFRSRPSSSSPALLLILWSNYWMTHNRMGQNNFSIIDKRQLCDKCILCARRTMAALPVAVTHTYTTFSTNVACSFKLKILQKKTYTNGRWCSGKHKRHTDRCNETGYAWSLHLFQSSSFHASLSQRSVSIRILLFAYVSANIHTHTHVQTAKHK